MTSVAEAPMTDLKIDMIYTPIRTGVSTIFNISGYMSPTVAQEFIEAIRDGTITSATLTTSTKHFTKLI